MLITERIAKMATKTIIKNANADLEATQGKMKNGFSSVESALEKVLTAYDRAFNRGYVVKKYSYKLTAYSEEHGYKRSMKYKKPTVKCTVSIVGGKIRDIAFERDELYPEQTVVSKVVTDGYETRKDALTRFLRTDHPFRTGDENATWDTMLHNMRDFAVYG
jgi:hypothetical protein